MNEPFVGKSLDVLNKRALASFLTEDEAQAEKLWKQALLENPRHFDSQVNYALFQWKTARIDDEELIKSLS